MVNFMSTVGVLMSVCLFLAFISMLFLSVRLALCSLVSFLILGAILLVTTMLDPYDDKEYYKTSRVVALGSCTKTSCAATMADGNHWVAYKALSIGQTLKVRCWTDRDGKGWCSNEAR